jgi:hypothetical protein
MFKEKEKNSSNPKFMWVLVLSDHVTKVIFNSGDRLIHPRSTVHHLYQLVSYQKLSNQHGKGKIVKFIS